MSEKTASPDFTTVTDWGIRYDGGHPITWGRFHGVKCPKCDHQFKPVVGERTTCPACGYFQDPRGA